MHIDSMLDSLDGLSVGDALGQQFPVMRRSLDDLRAGESTDGARTTPPNTPDHQLTGSATDPSPNTESPQ
jgi:hypothetical protein